MRDIRALLVDDEPIANDGLSALLRRHADVQVVGKCRSTADAATQIRRLTPDVVFLDVQMPGMDGFGLVDALGTDVSPIIVFVTAHDEHALHAFDVNAIDYLLKPVADEKLSRAMRRIRSQLDGRRAMSEGRGRVASSIESDAVAADEATRPITQKVVASSHAEGSYLSRLTVRSGRRTVVIPVCDIDWVAADDYCVNVVARGRRHVLRASLASLETKLDPSTFVRVHRSALVNVSRVKEWHSTPLRRLILVLADDTRLRVSRSRKARLLALLRGNSSVASKRAPDTLQVVREAVVGGK